MYVGVQIFALSGYLHMYNVHKYVCNTMYGRVLARANKLVKNTRKLKQTSISYE